MNPADTPCPVCGAEIGMPCDLDVGGVFVGETTGGGYFHARRVEQAARREADARSKALPVPGGYHGQA